MGYFINKPKLGFNLFPELVREHGMKAALLFIVRTKFRRHGNASLDCAMKELEDENRPNLKEYAEERLK